MSDSTNRLPRVTIQQLADAGVHYGHKKCRCNPAMEPYIFGTAHTSSKTIKSKSNTAIHIIDLRKTMACLDRATKAIYDTVLNKGKVLFVGTKIQARDAIKEEALKCGQYYINHRWLGGMMTNWKTVSKSIKSLKDLNKTLESEDTQLTKKEILNLTRKRDKIDSYLGGISEMRGVPNLLIVMDSYRDRIAVKEAKTLGIPVVCILDTNSNPKNITYPVPANDDLTRALSLYCKLFSDTVLAALEQQMSNSAIKEADSSSGRNKKIGYKKPYTTSKTANRDSVESGKVKNEKEEKETTPTSTDYIAPKANEE